MMGDNYAIIGFSSAEEIYNEMSAFYENQIEAMICYIKKLGLDQGTVKELPTREMIDVPVEEMLIVELYSK